MSNSQDPNMVSCFLCVCERESLCLVLLQRVLCVWTAPVGRQRVYKYLLLHLILAECSMHEGVDAPCILGAWLLLVVFEDHLISQASPCEKLLGVAPPNAEICVTERLCVMLFP